MVSVLKLGTIVYILTNQRIPTYRSQNIDSMYICVLSALKLGKKTLCNAYYYYS